MRRNKFKIRHLVDSSFITSSKIFLKIMSSSKNKISIAFQLFFVIFHLSLTARLINCSEDESIENNSQQWSPPLTHSESIMAQLYRRPDLYSSFIRALEATGLVEPLTIGGPFTLFAPLNTAFHGTHDLLARLASNPIEFRRWIMSYVVSGAYSLETLSRIRTLSNLAGGVNIFLPRGNFVTIDGIPILPAGNIMARNGLIHTINEVLPLRTI